MPITIPPIPAFTDPSAGGTTPDNARAESWAMINAKYADTWAMGSWAAGIMNSELVDLSATLGSTTVDADIAALATEIGDIIAFTPGTITGGTGTFTGADDLKAALVARLNADIATYSTGLAEAEAAAFSRELARAAVNAAKAYTEITSIFSSRGYDMPPGAMAAKLAEASAESARIVSDSSAKILEQTTSLDVESARLNVQYTLGIINASNQLIEALAKIFDSKESRAFEASKATVMLAAESYRNTLGLVTAKADIVLKKGEMVLATKARQLQLEVTTMMTLVQGFQQIIASAMNGVTTSTSFGFNGSQNQAFNTDV